MIPIEINERIQQLRKKLDLSRRAFGEQLGVSESVIVNIEFDRLKRPDQKEPLYKLICEKFNVSESWLRTGEGEMFVQAKEDLFARLAAENDLTDFDLMVLKTYVSLKPDQRQALVSFFNAMSAVKTDQQLSAEVDAEMAAELAAEREERIMEKDTPMSDPFTASSAG